MMKELSQKNSMIRSLSNPPSPKKGPRVNQETPMSKKFMEAVSGLGQETS